MKRSLILSLIVVAVLGIPTYGVNPTDHSFLIGTWVNVSPSPSMVAFIIYEDQSGDLVINAYGNCVPYYCNWGVVPCIDYSSDIGSNLSTGFMSFYDFGWKETWITATQFVYPRYNVLEVMSFHFYVPPDNRYDRWGYGLFIRI